MRAGGVSKAQHAMVRIVQDVCEARWKLCKKNGQLKRARTL